MTDTTNHGSDSTTTTTTIIDVLENHYPEHEPVVRYAFPTEDGEPRQEPILRSIHADIPNGANWASAIYLITAEQRERLEEHADEPHGNPSSKNIAKTIQDECENWGRVLYSVHAESDAHEDEEDDEEVVALETMIGWLQNFVQTVIDTDSADCTFYYSGNRSIHAHSPLFVSGDNLGWLKDQTKQFCDVTDAELDASVYKRKPQFRIPGVYHEDKGLQKVEIDTDWNHTEIIRTAASDVERPSTYADVLKTIFTSLQSTNLSELLVSSAVANIQSTSQSNSTSQSSSVLSAWPSRYLGQEKRRAYTAKEFYPYPTGDDHDGRSIASVKIIDEPFQRREAGRVRSFVPCYFYGAHSCSGRDFTMDHDHAPLQLSKKDEPEWDYQEGETVIVIGGGNYKSITHKVEEKTAERVGSLLDPKDGDRDDALDYLRDEDYDVGSAGPSQPTNSARDQQSTEQEQDDSNPDEKTDAQRYKERAEQGSVEMSLSHDERRKVANRLLTIEGWDYAWNWFREQYGSDFDPQRTWKGLHRVIKTFPDDFAHIEVPPEP